MKPARLAALSNHALPQGLRPACSYQISSRLKFFTRPLKGLIDLHQTFIGLGCLLLGVLVYVTARPSGALFLPETFNLSLYFPVFLTHLTGPLPVFFHVLGFSLLTAAFLAPDKKITVAICLGWAGINGLFEVGQHAVICTWLSTHLPAGVQDIWFIEQTLSYFRHGTFDPADIAASLVAAAIAYSIIRYTTQLRGG